MKPPFKLPLRIVTLTQGAVTKYRVVPDDADNIGPIVFETFSSRDADYIAHAANNYPTLQAEVERLREALADCEGWLRLLIEEKAIVEPKGEEEIWRSVLRAQAALHTEGSE